MGQGGPTGGAQLGQATGSIVINTQSVTIALATVQQASAAMTRSMNNISASTNRAQANFSKFSAGLNQISSALGVSLGAAAVAQVGRFVVEADKLATAYDRQSVAARTLAGSQEQLNEFLRVYDRATGGALDKATSLANVTKLMAVGFADSAPELEKFARTIRGISIAMGQSQDTVTQNLILELFTQRGARLDQLGLQYDKVRQRADQLQATDSKLTQQMAYQQAVLEQAEERFGALADSTEGAKTGIEELQKAWTNFQLQLGQTSSDSLDQFFKFCARVPTH